MLIKTVATDIKPTDIGFLIVGPAGSGKSRFAADMAELGKTLILYTDKKAGKSTYQRSPNAANIELWGFEDTDLSQPTTTEDFARAVNELLVIPREEFPYDFVWLDALTSYGAMVMRWVIWKNVMYNKGGKHVGTGYIGHGLDKLSPTQTDHNVLINHIQCTVDELLLLPCTVGVIAHEMGVYNDNGNLVENIIATAGKATFAKNLPSRFSEMYRAYQRIDQMSGDCTLQMMTTGNDIYPWCSSKGLDAPATINGFQDIKSLMLKRKE